LLFDAASQTLRLLEQEEHIIALTPSSIIWDKETTNVPGGKPRFYRIIYKVSDYDPNQPNPTPDTVYEPIEMLLLSFSQHWEDKYGEPFGNTHIHKEVFGYSTCSHALFRGIDTPFNLREAEVYFWIEDLQGRIIPQGSYLWIYPINKPENTIGAYHPEYDPLTDFQMSICPTFPDMGEYYLRVKIYEPATKKYYVGPDYKFTFSETDFGTYTKIEYN